MTAQGFELATKYELDMTQEYGKRDAAADKMFKPTDVKLKVFVGLVYMNVGVTGGPWMTIDLLNPRQ